MANSVQVKVGERIADLGPRVEDEVVETLVAREVDKRAKALVDVIDKIDVATKELRKIKPDQVSFDEAGKEVAGATFSKARFEDLKKAREKIDKLERAVNKALEKADFSDVYNLASGKQPSEPPPAES